MNSLIEKSARKRKRSNIGIIPDNLKSASIGLLINSCYQLIQNFSSKHLNNKAQDSSAPELTPERILKTLIRGLGSSNDQVQRNYFAALVMVQKSLSASADLSSTFSLENIFDVMQSELHLKEVSSKGEEGEVLLGRVLTFGTVVRSGTMITAPRDKQAEVFSCLLEDVQRKSYLPLVADPFIIEYLKQADEDTLRECAWPAVRERVAPGAAQTPLVYHLMLVCEERLPNEVAETVAEAMSMPTVLSPAVMPALVTALKMEFRMRFSSHPLFVDIFKYLANANDEVIRSFWTEAEKQLFHECGANYNKPMMAVKFFSLLVSQLRDASQAKTVVTPTLLSWAINRRSVPKAVQVVYAQVCKDALDDLCKLCFRTESSKAVLAVIKQLLFTPGNKMMEEPAGLRVVQQVLGQLKESGVTKLADWLRAVLEDDADRCEPVAAGADDSTHARIWRNRDKLNAVHLFCKLLALPTMQAYVDWRLQQLQFLFNAGFFTTSHIGVELAGHIRDSFFSNLNHRLHNLADFRKLLASLVDHINTRLENGDQLRIKISTEVIPEWKKMYKAAKKIGESKKYKKEPWVVSVFQTMFYHIGLHLFKEANFAVDTLQELHCVLERLGGGGESGDDGPRWTQVLVEMLLSLVSRNSQAHRHLANCVFPHLCPVMEPENIHQMLQVLDPSSSSDPLLDSLEPVGSDSDSDAEGASSDGNGEGETEVGGGEDDDEAESSDDGMSDGDADEEVDEKQTDRLRKAVFEALGDNALTDVESVDLDDMDEAEAARMDRALSLAFRTYRGGRREKRASAARAKALLNFRLRVLDLVEGWLNSEPPLDLLVDTLLALLNTLQHALTDRRQAPLESRLRSIIKKTSKFTSKKFKTTDCQAMKIGPILKSLFEKGDKSSTVQSSVFSELNAISQFLVKSSQHIEDDPEVSKVLEEVVNGYFKNRDTPLPVSLFHSLFRVNAPPVAGLVCRLPEYAFDRSVIAYRRSKALEFMLDFCRNHRDGILSNELEKELKKAAKNVLKKSAAMIEDENNNPKLRFFEILKKLLPAIHKKWMPDVGMKKHLKNLKAFQRSKAEIKKQKRQLRKEKKNKINNGDGGTEVNEEVNEAGPEGKNIVEQKIGGAQSVDEEEMEIKEEGSDDDKLDVSDEDEPPTKKSKNKSDKRSREKLKKSQMLKKSSKTRRMESMSAGLEDSVFNSTNLSFLAKQTKMTSPDR